jgi:hypothetical protein
VSVSVERALTNANFTGQTKHLTDENRVNGTTVTSLKEVNGATWKSMKSRMGMKIA